MGGCQNHGPLLGPLNTKCRIVLRNQKETIILTTAHSDCTGLLRGVTDLFSAPCFGRTYAKPWCREPDNLQKPNVTAGVYGYFTYLGLGHRGRGG